MKKINRLPIKLLARHSDWRPKELDAALDEHVRSDAERWRWLLRMLLPALGIGFLACGILFFFAYNWADIPKFGKLGVAAAAVVVPCGLSLLPVFSDQVRSMLLTAAAFLVGPLFGVFGQIYQTGANAYDLFVAWTLFIAIWAIVANFAPLWVLFIGLVNVTVVLYSEQIASGWSFVLLAFTLFAINAVAAVSFTSLQDKVKRISYPQWLIQSAALAAAACGTLNCCTAIMEFDERPGDLLYLVPVFLVFAAVASCALRTRNLYYLTLLALAVIAMVATIIVRIDLDLAGFLAAALWVVGGTTGSIIILNTLRKEWRHE